MAKPKNENPAANEPTQDAAPEGAPQVADGVVVSADLQPQLDAALAEGKTAFMVTPNAIRIDA